MATWLSADAYVLNIRNDGGRDHRADTRHLGEPLAGLVRLGCILHGFVQLADAHICRLHLAHQNTQQPTSGLRYSGIVSIIDDCEQLLQAKS